MKNKFNSCEICNSNNWELIYEGKIRDGYFGKILENASIGECLECGVQRLDEENCIPSEYYESGEYRKKLQQSLVNDKALKEQDYIQKYMIDAVGGLDVLRNQFVVDVGCGVGSLLDMICGITSDQIGIEPCKPYFDILQQKEYKVYPDLSLTLEKNNQTLDWALSGQVIEHVEYPVKFFKEIFNLLKPGGQALISTPNRNDILINLLPEFKEFFYRTQHRWYFDKKSIEYCADIAGFEVLETKFIHRYGLANTIHWLRDRKPKGNIRIDQFSEHADKLWSAYLQNSGQTDNLFCHLVRPF